MEKLVNVVRWGNSAGILVPRAWLGKQVRIELVDRTEKIRKEVLDILENDLDDIIGIYLIGSYARNEQTKESDIDIIAVSSRIRKTTRSGKYDIEVYPIDNIKKTIKNHPIMILPSLIEARPIMNKHLLEELLNKRMSKNAFKKYFEECKRVIKINKEFIELDKLEGDVLESKSVIYTTFLRLRGIYLIKTILEGKRYSKKDFIRWLIFKTEIEKNVIEIIYNFYKNMKDNKKFEAKIDIDIVLKFVKLLEKEVKQLEKKKKA